FQKSGQAYGIPMAITKYGSYIQKMVLLLN
ncbi:uncharacterized protein METZ01_LOCUS110564, partial [marine metagenome]